jgi:hypothetical protein
VADRTVTIPTLAWVLPLVGLVCWAWYRTMYRLWDRYVTPWVLQRLAARYGARCGCLHPTLVSAPLSWDAPHPTKCCQDCGKVVIYGGADA